MSDQNSTPDADTSSSDETPMVPHELTPGQLSDDPVPNDPDAAGTPNDDADHAVDGDADGSDDDADGSVG